MTEDNAGVKPSGNQTRLQQAFTRVEGGLDRTAKFLRKLALLEILDQLSRLSIVVVALVYVLEADDRRRERIYRAWQIVNAAHDTQASGGRVDALEDLVRSDVSLARIKLEGVSLRGATLNGADLSHAQLGQADLSGTKLRGANLSGADLRLTNLSGADLTGAKVEARGWLNTDLTGANLTDATLGGPITQEILDMACGSDATKVPEGLRKPKPCNN